MPLFDKNYDMLYNDYNKMRNAVPTQPIAYRTVFNDIADEWANCTEEERRFIDGDPEYVNANLTYQQQFNAFLLDMVGLQFINSQYGKSAESVLVTLKNAKAKYKKEAAESIASVKAENAALQKQLEELKILVSSGGRS
jgi:hypothetical protein